LLAAAEVPLAEVRLLRHKDKRAEKGRTPYELWRDNLPKFNFYQATQTKKNRKKLNAPYWAVFVGTPEDETLFVGLYRVKYQGLLKQDTPTPHRDAVDKAGSCDVFRLKLDERLGDLIGKLVIDWGLGMRSWIQRADRQDKPIVELRPEFKEPDFPG